MLQFANLHNIGAIVDDDPVVDDVDAALKWARNPASTTENCRNASGVWSLFIDLCATLPNQCDKLKTEIDSALAIEQKLFFGSNWPSFTPDGECYEPQWDDDEKAILQTVFTNGAIALRRSIKTLMLT